MHDLSTEVQPMSRVEIISRATAEAVKELRKQYPKASIEMLINVASLAATEAALGLHMEANNELLKR